METEENFNKSILRKIFLSRAEGMNEQKNVRRAGCWWLNPTIIATQEAEIRRGSWLEASPGE
jgi:hypothetical protein